MTRNTGGREKFPTGKEVQVLLLTGEIDSKTYVIEPEPLEDGTVNPDPPDFVRADRKGHVLLREKGGIRTFKVHFRRILLLDSNGKATVIESSDKYRAICPKCGNVFNVQPNCERIICPDDGEFELNWLGAKPMTTDMENTDMENTENTENMESMENMEIAEDTTTVTTTVAAEAAAAAAVNDEEKTKPKAEKKKSAKEPILVDFDVLKGLPECELWTKRNVKFDHPEVDVRAHCLLFTGDSPRKYCFNTYNGALGKKSQALHTREFVADEPVTGGKRERPWFVVKDLEKEQANLAKNGYEKP